MAGKYKVLLIAENPEHAEQLNQLLWTYDPGSFLPHGTVAGGNSEQQPVLIADAFDVAHQANLLAVTNGTTPPKPEHFERILDIFDGRDPQAVEMARERWKNYKESGHALTYLRQTESGGWEQKAVA